jgi:hypothetical protein
VALLECSASVPKSEDEFYLARETESFSVCAGNDRLLANHQGRLPRICLPYTDNVDDISGERGASVRQSWDW